MATSTKVTVQLSCFVGPFATFSFHVASSIVDPNDPVILGLITVLDGVTRGRAVQITVSLQTVGVSSATVGANYVSEDKALMRFLDDNGVTHSYKVPGLLPSILDTDKETIKPDDTDVEDYTAAIIDNALTQSGDPISSFVSGHRVENRKPIKAGRVT